MRGDSWLSCSRFSTTLPQEAEPPKGAIRYPVNCANQLEFNFLLTADAATAAAEKGQTASCIPLKRAIIN